MAIYLSDLLKDPGILLRRAPPKRERYGDHPMDEAWDDYYEQLGRVIEQHPIGGGRPKR